MPRLTIRRLDHAVLEMLQGPSFNIPFPLRDTSHIVVDEETFCLEAEDEAIGDGTGVGDEGCERFEGEGVGEEVDGFDLDFVRIGGVVWSSL